MFLMCDLHTHPLADKYYCSYTSPRRLPAGDAIRVREFLLAAVDRGLDVVAVTDHDCVASGWFAQEAAREEGMPLVVIPGVEVTTKYKGRTVHILGYYVEKDLPPAFLSPVEAVREIFEQGGFPVLAHPPRYGELADELYELCLLAGDCGVEVYNARSGKFEAESGAALAALETKGSDWHYYPTWKADAARLFSLPLSVAGRLPLSDARSLKRRGLLKERDLRRVCNTRNKQRGAIERAQMLFF